MLILPVQPACSWPQAAPQPQSLSLSERKTVAAVQSEHAAKAKLQAAAAAERTARNEAVAARAHASALRRSLDEDLENVVVKHRATISGAAEHRTSTTKEREGELLAASTRAQFAEAAAEPAVASGQCC